MWLLRGSRLRCCFLDLIFRFIDGVGKAGWFYIKGRLWRDDGNDCLSLRCWKEGSGIAYWSAGCNEQLIVEALGERRGDRIQTS